MAISRSDREDRISTDDSRLHVLDPQEAKANEFAPPEGFTTNQVEAAIRMVKECFTIAATTVASYDPDYDNEGKTFSAGIMLMNNVVARN